MTKTREAFKAGCRREKNIGSLSFGGSG